MENNIYHVLGVMSGTSLDGIDLCFVKFQYHGKWSFEIIHAETIAYTQFWKSKLNDAINDKGHISEINEAYTEHLGNVIKDFLERYEIINSIDAVCSHGHTIFHEPDNGYTLQIGNLPNLASQIGVKLICDFRTQDVKLGGQGAPLVPIGDGLLFNDYMFCINLGGFANLSFEQDGQRIAYDICPANIVLNHYIRKEGLEFDDKGIMASNGLVNSTLLDKLNSLAYYGLEAPKSLGLEWVLENIYPLVDKFDLTTSDILRTFVEHIAIQISKAIEHSNYNRVLITGGGAFNNFLMKRIESNTNNTIVIPDRHTIEYKEALIFGLLGVLKMRGEVNCLSSVTGAKYDHSSGVIFLP